MSGFPPSRREPRGSARFECAVSAPGRCCSHAPAVEPEASIPASSLAGSPAMPSTVVVSVFPPSPTT